VCLFGGTGEFVCVNVYALGMDALVAVIAARLGLVVRLVRLVKIEDGGDGALRVVDKLMRPENVKGSKLGGPRMIENSFVGFGISIMDCGLGEDAEELLGDVEWCVGLPHSYEKNGPPRAPILDDVYVSYEGYFGNEAGTGCVYSHVAMLVDVPPADQRGPLLSSMAEFMSDIESAAGCSGAASAFEGCRVGVGKEEEEKLAKQAMKEAGNPLTTDDLRRMASRSGVSTAGGARSIERRLGEAAEQDRYERMRMMGMMDPALEAFLSGGDFYDEDNGDY
jgi:hypothetical protein